MDAARREESDTSLAGLGTGVGETGVGSFPPGFEEHHAMMGAHGLGVLAVGGVLLH